MQDQYAAQHRGSASAYAQYFAGMDASMQQKVALTTAFFPTAGKIADMGSGSGRGTYDLACLYPRLELVGVDINPLSVERSRESYRRANLRYEVGDIADTVFAPSSLDGVLDSSVLHHVTSFNDFSLARLETCLRNQVAALRPGGVLIIRDFVVPDGPERVLLDLPEQDGARDGSEIQRLSTAQLFERFAATFRSSLHRAGGVPFARAAAPRSGVMRYELLLRDAAEFILRKDYRADWDTELLEEYTYYSQAQFEAALRALGLRVLASVPIHNPWIVEHRYRGKIALLDRDENELPFPPTNYFVVGEKIGEGEPIALEQVGSRQLAQPKFFVPRTYRDRDSGKLVALAERPGHTLDLVPWLLRGERVHVLAKKGFPRPLLTLGARVSGFITEPIAAIVSRDEPREAAVARILQERAGVPAAAICGLAERIRYFTSPGGLDECVDAELVELDPEVTLGELHEYGDFGESGSVRELDAAQLLRAAQVGGMFDARVEIGAYRALARAGQALDRWIGAAIALTQRDAPLRTQRRPEPPRARFERCDEPCDYLRYVEDTFLARAADGRELSRAVREHVVPREASERTVSVLPVMETPAGVFVGLELREFPAVENHAGCASLEVCPAFRLPREVVGEPDIERFVRARLAELGLEIDGLIPLGGPYAPRAGATPERVMPFAATVTAVHAPALRFALLGQLRTEVDKLLDAHTIISVLRLHHALKRD
jgi:SAM-dependent methyltransferase